MDNLVSFVYVISDNLGHYKIGFSSNPKSRIAKLNIGPTHLTFEAVIPTLNSVQSFEKELHKKFRNKRIKGEWFRLDKNDLTYLYELEGRWINTIYEQPFMLDSRYNRHIEEQLIHRHSM